MEIITSLVESLTDNAIILATISVVGRLLLKRLSKTFSQYEKFTEEFLLLKEANQAALRDRLTMMHKHYMRQGWADESARRNFENVYDIYHRLGENGVMDDYRREFKNLPTTPPEIM